MTDQQTHSLSHIRVKDCMHHGVMTCREDDSIRHAARIMSNYRVHAVVIANGNGARAVGIVSDLDVATAAATGAECMAIEAAATEPLTVSSEASLERAAQMMSEHGVSHLVVLDSAGGYPLGILSTLDIAAVFAGD
ncbi:MAG TPA: CBS domain-containing protein [Solirubrobacteraceae bacterium]|nr:CBS domain-containing protein [Solirubrobacteraceae bacterium]